MNKDIFVGRKNEIDILNKLYNEAKEGLGKVVFVNGEPGSGKTALVRHFINQKKVEKDILSAISECTDKEGLNSYATFKDILLELNVDAASDTLENKKKLKNNLKDFIIETGPKWIGIIPMIGSISAAGIETAQAAKKYFGKQTEKKIASEKEINEIVEEELRRLAQKQAIIIFIDDLQWSDTASLNLLYSLSLSIRKRPFPILLISSYRPNEIKAGRNKISDIGENITIPHPLTDKLDGLRNYTKKESHIERNDQWLHEIVVPALANNEIEDLLNSRFPENDFPQNLTDKLNDLTDGHALFVNEILESLVAKKSIFEKNGKWQVKDIEMTELPVSVNAVIAERVTRLDKDLRKVLDYAGVCGEDFIVQVVNQVLKIDELDLLDYIQELSEKHGLVVSGEARPLKHMIIDLYKFTHALVRKYVYENQEAARRRALHKRIAQSISKLYGDDLDKNPESKNLYEMHKRMGSGVIDGIDFKFSKETVKNETVTSVLNFASEEISSAQKAYEQFATEEVDQRVDRALAFINQLNNNDKETLQARFNALYIRALNQIRSGLYKNALLTCDILMPLTEHTQNIEAKAKVLKQKGIVLFYLAQYEKSIENLKQALNIYNTLGAKEKEIAMCYNELGATYNFMANYDEAIEHFEKALEINRNLNLIDEVAQTLTNIGTSYRFRSDYIKAKPFYEQALPLAQALNKKQLLARIYNNIGLTINGAGHFAEAITYFKKALEIDKELNDTVNLSNHTSNIGLSYEYQGNYDKAIKYYSRSLELDESIDDNVKMAISYNNLGSIYTAKADYDKALQSYTKALDINIKNKDKVAIGHSYTQLGNFYYTLDKLDEAEEFMQKSLAISLDLDDQAAIATDYNNLGNLLFSKGDNDKAMEYFQKTYEINKKLGNKITLSSVFNNMGNVMYMKNKHQQALDYYSKSIEISIEFNDLISLARSYGNTATIYYYMAENSNSEDKMHKHYESAKLYYEKAINYDRELNDTVNLVTHLYKYAKLTFEKYSKEEALKLFTEVIELYTNLENNDDELLRAMSFKAYCLEALGRNEDAENAYLKVYNTAGKKAFYEYRAGCANDFADYYEINAKYKEAWEWRNKAAAYFDNLKGYNVVAEIYERSAMNYFNSENYKEAAQLFLEYVLPNYKLSKDTSKIGGTYNRMGNIYLRLNDYDKALESYNLALEMFNNDDLYWTAILYFNMALVFNFKKNFDKSLEFFDKAKQMYITLEMHTDASECVFWKAKLYYFKNDEENAINYLNKAINLYTQYDMDLGELREMKDILTPNSGKNTNGDKSKDDDDDPNFA